MEYVIISFYIFLYFVAFRSMRKAIFLYLFFIPIRDLLHIEIFGLLGLNGVFLFILFYHFFKNGYVKRFFTMKSKYLNELLNFTFFAFTVIFLNMIRQAFLLQDYSNTPVTATLISSKIIIFIISIINIGVLIKIALSFNNIRLTVYRSMIFSLITIVLTIYFAPFLDSIGLDARGIIEDSTKALDELDRISGFFYGGDVNALSTTLNLVVSIILINAHVLKKKLSFLDIGVILLLSTGIFLTGSRMGFATLIILFVFYSMFLLTKQDRKNVFTFSNLFYFTTAIIIILFLIHTSNKFQLVFERLSNQGLTNEIEQGGPRFIRWIGFINFTFEDINRALFGSSKIFYAFREGEYRDPHSFFIQTLYLNGVLVLILFIGSFVKLLLSLKRIHLLKYSLLLSIIVLISLLIISQTIFINYYLLYLGCLVHQTIYNNNS